MINQVKNVNCEENMNRKQMSIKYKMASWKLENPIEVQNCQAKGGGQRIQCWEELRLKANVNTGQQVNRE